MIADPANTTKSTARRPEEYLKPEVARLVQRLDLRARFIVEGYLAGRHASPYKGFSLEFSEHRKYVPGDDPSTLDWNAWAKTDRLYVKTFEAETNLTAYLLVDTSRSMAYTGDARRMTKLEYVTALAAALGYLLTRQRDRVGLGLMGRELEKLIPPHASRRQLVRILAELAEVEPSDETRLAPAIHAVARRVRKRSLMVLLSDLMDEPEPLLEAVRHLAFAGHDVVVFHVLDPVERGLGLSGPVVLRDPETGREVATDADRIREAYRERLERFAAGVREGVGSAGGDFVSITTSTPFDRALGRFLRDRRKRF